MRRFLAAAVSLLPLAAQDVLPARAFLPADFRNAMHVDLAALRTHGIWDELEGSLLSVMFQQMEKEAGFKLRAVDRVTMVVFPVPEEQRAGRREVERVAVLESSQPLGVGASMERWTEDTVGKFTVRTRGEDLWVEPRIGLRVQGSSVLVRPVLEGKPHSGVPSPDVMSLLSGKAESLAWMVFDAAVPDIRRQILTPLFPDVEWPAGDAPTFLCLRVLRSGEEDDPRLVVEAVLRHAREGEGVACSLEAVAALRERLLATPSLRLVRPVLQKVTTRVDRADLVATIDLGRARDAAGNLAVLAGAMLLPADAATLEAVEVVPATAPPPEQPK